MADPVSILGTVVGVASLAIQTTQILHDYCKGVSDHKSDIEGLLTETQQLGDVLDKLRKFLETDSTKLSTSFTTVTSSLYSVSIRCKIRLMSLLDELQKHGEGSKIRRASKALKWPLKAGETSSILAELRGYIQTFQLALTLDGCQLLLKTSDEVSRNLQNSIESGAHAQQNFRVISSILEATSELPQTALNTNRAVQKLEVHAQVEDKEKILDWLGGTHAAETHQSIRRRRLKDTGKWLFEDNAYKQWHEDSRRVLWCQGQPGAGKSVLMSCVVDTLEAAATAKHGIGFFYSEYAQVSDTQTPEAIMATFVRQLTLRLKEVPQELTDLYLIHISRSTRPLLEEYVALIQHMCSHFSRTWLLVDALDELEPEVQDDTLKALESLTEAASIFVTSRPQSIDSINLERVSLRCEISAKREDLDAVIADRLGRVATATRRLREHPGWETFVLEANEKLVQKADGMFILVAFQLDMLLKPRTLAEMKKVLEGMPQKLPDFYSLTLDRIHARESSKAFVLLAWLTKALRPMKASELSEALAVEPCATAIDRDDLISEEDMVEMCCGLVKFEANDTVSLAHATVHEYLVDNLSMLEDFDSRMSRTCLNYLNFAEFNTQVEDWQAYFQREFSDKSHEIYEILESQEKYADRIRAHPFIDYAGRYWCEHYKLATEPDELLDPIMTLLQGPNAAAMLQAFSKNKSIDFNGFPPLHAVVVLGSLRLTQLFLNRATDNFAQEESPAYKSTWPPGSIVDCADGFGNTPLLYAVLHKHHAIAKLLLETKAVNPSIQDNTIIRWTLKWDNEELLRLMVDLPDFNADLARRQFGEDIEKFLQPLADPEESLRRDTDSQSQDGTLLPIRPKAE